MDKSFRIISIGTCSNPQMNCFTGQSVMFDGIIGFMKNRGLKVTVIDISNKVKAFGKFNRLLDYFVVLSKLLFKLLFTKYNLAYIVSSQSKRGFLRDYAMIMLCRCFRVRVVTHQYGANYYQLLNSLDEKGLAKLKGMLDYVSSIIVEGDYMKNQFSFLPDYMNKVKAIPNGLPILGKSALIAKEYNPNQPFVMFYLSNLIWSKGYYDVLQAVNILVNKEKLNVKCVFSGRFMASVDDVRPGISNKEDFDIFVAEHQLSEYVEYYPGLYGEAKDEYFHKSNVFLLPTYYINEGQPVSIIEAMAYGCVPLVTEYRHIPMMINDKNGCFVNAMDPQDIANKIKYLINNTEEYAAKSRQCIEDFNQKFKFDVYAEKVMDCLNSIMS